MKHIHCFEFGKLAGSEWLVALELDGVVILRQAIGPALAKTVFTESRRLFELPAASLGNV